MFGFWATSTRKNNNSSGQIVYSTPGTYSWTAPAGVTSVCVVCVGGAASFTGGGLGWKNNISVTPGSSYTVEVGGFGGDSYFIDTSTVRGGGGNGSGPNTGGTFTGDGGGNGGNASLTNTYGGRGGAGGYSGNGGQGGNEASGGTSGSGASTAVAAAAVLLPVIREEQAVEFI